MSKQRNNSTSSTALAAIAVFLGGASYGFMAPLAKIALAQGATWQQIVAGQEVFGCLLFGIALLIVVAKTRLRPVKDGTNPALADKTKSLGALGNPNTRHLTATELVRLTPHQVLRLLGVGACTCGTCVFYNISLSLLPVAGAITMLFQFTWIGVVIQVVVTKRPPAPHEILAALIVVAGTLFASGFIGFTPASLDPLGIVCGLISAVFCATFMHLTGCVETNVPLIQRGFVIAAGAALAATAACPNFIPGGFATSALMPCWLALGATALFLPVFLFSAGTHKLPTGVSTVLASAELPCSILLTFIFTGEGAGPLQILGIVLILLGVATTQWSTLRPPVR